MQYEIQGVQCLYCNSLAKVADDGSITLKHKDSCMVSPNYLNIIPKPPYHPNQRLEAARREIAEMNFNPDGKITIKAGCKKCGMFVDVLEIDKHICETGSFDEDCPDCIAVRGVIFPCGKHH